MTKPTLLLLHGAFGRVSCFDSLSQRLTDKGYQCVVPPYPSVDADLLTSETTHCSQDIEEVRQKTLLPLVETEKKDVVIFAHSYGGQIAAVAAEGLLQRTRAAAGLTGGVIGMIYLAGNIVPEGKSLQDVVGGQWPPFLKIDEPEPGFCVFDPVIGTLFNDVEDSSQHAELAATMIPHRTAVFSTPAPRPVWLDAADGGPLAGRLASIRTLRDQVFSPSKQDAFLEMSGVHWKVVDLDAGHSAYITKPDAVSEIIDRFACAWSAEGVDS